MAANTLETIAQDVERLRRHVEGLSVPNRYQTVELLKRDKYIRNGMLTEAKFRRICELLRQINEQYSDTAGFYTFSLPKNVANVSGSSGALDMLYSFVATAVRQPRPLTPKQVLGLHVSNNPDLFIDYLLTLLDKQATVSTYVPAMLEAVSLKDIDQMALKVILRKFIDAYVSFVLAMRPNLPDISNVGEICAQPLVQHLLLPMLRHALISPVSGDVNREASFVGIQDLPTRITINLKDGVRESWKSLFTTIDQYDYNAVDDGPMLKSLEMILDSLDNQTELPVALFQLYTFLNNIDGIGSRNASVLTLLVYAVVHYVVRALFMHLLITGDRALTGSDFDAVIENDSGLFALMGRTSPRVLIRPEDDPDLFFTFGQKAYIQVVDVHWTNLLRNWPLMNLSQKKQIREAVQKKIEERLAFDRVLLDKDTVAPEPMVPKRPKVLNQYDFYEL